MIIVFDFDKTLTYKDSLSELFKEHAQGIQKVLYFVLKLCSKLGLISVKKEKMTMIRLLFGSNEECFAEACKNQAKEIQLSPIMDTLNQYLNQNNNRVIVLSASATYLLNEIFKGTDVEIMGSDFITKDGIIIAFRHHPFDKEKIDVLKDNGITEIDEVYFDSHHDYCLKTITRNWYCIKNGLIVKSNKK